MKAIIIEQVPVTVPEAWSVFSINAAITAGGRDVLHLTESHPEGMNPVMVMAGLVVRTEVEASRLAAIAKYGPGHAEEARSSLLKADDEIVRYATDNALTTEQTEQALKLAEKAIKELSMNPDQRFDVWHTLANYHQRSTVPVSGAELWEESLPPYAVAGSQDDQKNLLQAAAA